VLNAPRLSDVLLIGVKLKVVMLSVVMLNVAAPFCFCVMRKKCF
jgi:hypothetical protein